MKKSLALLAALALVPPAHADWTVTLSPTKDQTRCATSTGVGQPVLILPCDGSDAQKWITGEGCGTTFWQSQTGQDVVLQAGYDWNTRRWSPRSGTPFILNSTWTRPGAGMVFVRDGETGQIEDLYADQFVGYHQCLDWRDGAGETLQLWECIGRVDGPVGENQRWTVSAGQGEMDSEYEALPYAMHALSDSPRQSGH
ncbi:hypothetical protein A1Q1_01105 [Trichosporon asahii var. asahii CBS 2479]|uniref:Uncharacterized protein n=1 Tax=Trichosporon asahii var. asahii (strain ATCC 90039 / CBS 2479 / JCM 2466 / KCTC 7840 / NBRC 103889/ NCYC 2677 / UAMH 7654) TaxID=1186058 RepID=J6EYK9_TRIAS|nr:hypothetical protein A1Q1_01105 [Trichosporon asahii var. asahii CBS 2479]EJT49749.1 hypothetical protein A1Q1_01105 [Trichosporon asahii var. asahii CBS 2479]